MFDYIGNAIVGSFVANMIISIIGVIAAIAGSIVLYKFVFGPKVKDKNAPKAVKIANGQHFLPLSFVKIGYYACAIYLVFLGISLFPLMGVFAIPAFFGVAVIGNVILHFVYELLLAARKNAGLDTDSGTAEEPKVEPQAAAPQQYQQYQQPQQYQQMPQYQQPVPPMPQQVAPAPVPQPVPPMPQQVAPAPVPQPVPPMPQQVAPAPVSQPVPPMPQQAAPAPVPQPVPPMPQQAPAPQAAAEVACPNCGKPMKPGAKFCPFCGKPTV